MKLGEPISAGAPACIKEGTCTGDQMANDGGYEFGQGLNPATVYSRFDRLPRKLFAYINQFPYNIHSNVFI